MTTKVTVPENTPPKEVERFVDRETERGKDVDVVYPTTTPSQSK